MFSFPNSTVCVIHDSIECFDVTEVGSFESSQPSLSYSEKIRNTLCTGFEPIITEPCPYAIGNEYPEVRNASPFHGYRAFVSYRCCVCTNNALYCESTAIRRDECCEMYEGILGTRAIFFNTFIDPARSLLMTLGKSGK